MVVAVAVAVVSQRDSAVILRKTVVAMVNVHVQAAANTSAKLFNFEIIVIAFPARLG